VDRFIRHRWSICQHWCTEVCMVPSADRETVHQLVVHACDFAEACMYCQRLSAGVQLLQLRTSLQHVARYTGRAAVAAVQAHKEKSPIHDVKQAHCAYSCSSSLWTCTQICYSRLIACPRGSLCQATPHVSFKCNCEISSFCSA
jgi:hypothetical protein